MVGLELAATMGSRPYQAPESQFNALNRREYILAAGIYAIVTAYAQQSWTH